MEECKCCNWCSRDVKEVERTGHHEDCPKNPKNEVQMTVDEIMQKYLKDNGYDGLYYPGECCCKIDCMRVCGGNFFSCFPGYLQAKDENDTDTDYSIGRDKPEAGNGQ